MRASGVASLAAPLIAAAVLACAPAGGLPPVAPLPSPAPQEPTGWTEIRGSLFSLMTDVARSSAEAFASELELFVVLVKRLTGLARLPEEPLQIFVFANGLDFERYRLEPYHEGFFVSDGRRSFALMSASELSLEMRQKLFHEFTHYLISGSARDRDYPLWYSEGLAEMLSSVQWKDGSAIVGLPPARLAGARALGRWISLERLLSARTTSGMSLEDGSLFYAEAWALVHHLHTAKRRDGASRYRQMLDYLGQVRGGSEWRPAAERAFGAPLEDLEVELRQHWTTPTQELLGLRLDLATLEPAASGMPRSVPQADVDAKLALLTAVIREMSVGQRSPFAPPSDGGLEETPLELPRGD